MRLGHIAELGNPLKCLKGRGGEGVSVGYLSLEIKNEMVFAGMSVNIKYTVALFSALNVSVRKKQTFDLHEFLCILHDNELPLMLQTSTAITIMLHQLISFSLD